MLAHIGLLPLQAPAQEQGGAVDREDGNGQKGQVRPARQGVEDHASPQQSEVAEALGQHAVDYEQGPHQQEEAARKEGHSFSIRSMRAKRARALLKFSGTMSTAPSSTP